VQLCIVHLIRNSVKFVGYKERKVICADLKNIYKSSTVEEAETALDSFSDKWDKKYPNISQMWITKWDKIIPFFEYPEPIRKAIYTTNAIESMNMTMRKVIKNKYTTP
jgi:transposase-like protein